MLRHELVGWQCPRAQQHDPPTTQTQPALLACCNLPESSALGALLGTGWEVPKELCRRCGLGQHRCDHGAVLVPSYPGSALSGWAVRIGSTSPVPPERIISVGQLLWPAVGEGLGVFWCCHLSCVGQGGCGGDGLHWPGHCCAPQCCEGLWGLACQGGTKESLIRAV